MFEGHPVEKNIVYPLTFLRLQFEYQGHTELWFNSIKVFCEHKRYEQMFSVALLQWQLWKAAAQSQTKHNCFKELQICTTFGTRCFPKHPFYIKSKTLHSPIRCCDLDPDIFTWQALQRKTHDCILATHNKLYTVFTMQTSVLCQ